MEDVCIADLRSIVLTGFKGSGKTSVGKALAEKIGFRFIDIDTIMEDKFENSGHDRALVREIYKKYGHDFFKELEVVALNHAVKQKGVVLSLGGGTPLNKSFNKKDFINSLFVQIKAEPEIIYKRIEAGGFPPFVDKDNPRPSILKLLEERTPYYEKIADITVDSSSGSPTDTAKEIEKLLMENLNAG